jgi:gas vesicle protein
MESEDLPEEPPVETVERKAPTHGSAGFLAGIVFGAFLGAGLALLFAPEKGEKTRGRLRKRMRSLQEDALEGIDRAGTRTRKELRRRQQNLREELDRARERAKQVLE